MIAMAILLIGLVALGMFMPNGGAAAQGAESTAEAPVTTPIITEEAPVDAVGSAPANVSIEPNTVTLTGSGSIVVTVTYEDADGDASGFDWTVVDTDAQYAQVPDGRFSQAVVGTEIPVAFYCYQPNFRMDIELVVTDAAGNRSAPAPFTMICNDPLPTGGMDDIPPVAQDVPQPTPVPTPVDPGSAPTILAINPPEIFLTRNTATTVLVTYSDPDGDAQLFIWTMEDTDAIEYELPLGRFDQQVVGTEIPALFFCTTPGFYANISLTVADSFGNLSEPAYLMLDCR
jgi:hypothetical protein